MLKSSIIRLCTVLLVSMVFSSCINKKKVIYFQGALASAEANKNYSPLLRTDDFLSINVISSDLEASKPFNLPVVTTQNSINNGYSQGNASPLGYLIDSEGNIDFPVIGKLKIGGLTRTDATELIKTKLQAYITTPTVLVRILNYKITVLGDVKSPGTFNIPNERITLLEALGIAGDLNITAKRKNVIVIRDVDGKKTETKIDLTSKEVFASPVYYLQQNDVVYVEPNRAKINSSAINTANVGIIISVVSLITTISVLLSR